MSNHALYIKHGYPTANVSNAIGRFVPQLKRITFKFCKEHGASRGLRDFIEKDLVKLAEENPGSAIYLKPRRHRPPVVKAEYCDGTEKWMSLHDREREEIIKWVHLLVKQSSGESIRLRKKIHTDHPSIQGVWAPYTYFDIRQNIVKIPDEIFSRPVNLPKTASEKLIELYKKQEEAAKRAQEVNAAEEKEQQNVETVEQKA